MPINLDECAKIFLNVSRDKSGTLWLTKNLPDGYVRKPATRLQRFLIRLLSETLEDPLAKW